MLLTTTRLKLQGPKAKNYKVWQNKRADTANKWAVVKSPKQKVVSNDQIGLPLPR